jgi:cysteine desulfurase
MAESSIDMLSLSGHKLHAPKGIGVIYLRKGTPYRPFMVGGHQEKSRRAGTENTAAIIALGKAANWRLKYAD